MSKRLVCGVGINDAGYPIDKRVLVNGKRKVVWMCPYYLRWGDMLKRCYSEKLQEKRPTYKGCIVCDEWLLFSNFKNWMEQQEWKDRHLDKDFLFEGNKIYSPSTCVFLPSKLNSFITTRAKVRGLYPLGVSYVKKKKGREKEYNKPYKSEVNNQTGSTFYLGCYPTSEMAHQKYLQEKLNQCGNYLIEFKGEPLITKGLTRIYNKIKYHIENNLELKSF